MQDSGSRGRIWSLVDRMYGSFENIGLFGYDVLVSR